MLFDQKKKWSHHSSLYANEAFSELLKVNVLVLLP